MNTDAHGSKRPPAGESDTVNPYHSPWSGHLNKTELTHPGGLLLAALVGCTNDRGMQLNELAKELGVTYGYINQLRNGTRKANQISDEFALACSRFLCIPRLTVLMLAGRVTLEDLFEQDYMLATEVTKAMKFICEDSTWGHLITPGMRNGDEHSKFAIVKLYEAATGKILMDKSLQFETLASDIRRFQEHQFGSAKLFGQNLHS